MLEIICGVRRHRLSSNPWHARAALSRKSKCSATSQIKSSMPGVFRLLNAQLGIDIARSYSTANQSDQLRLIANVVKHARADRQMSLRADRQELFDHPAVRGLRCESLVSRLTEVRLTGRSPPSYRHSAPRWATLWRRTGRSRSVSSFLCPASTLVGADRVAYDTPLWRVRSCGCGYCLRSHW